MTRLWTGKLGEGKQVTEEGAGVLYRYCKSIQKLLREDVQKGHDLKDLKRIVSRAARIETIRIALYGVPRKRKAKK